MPTLSDLPFPPVPLIVGVLFAAAVAEAVLSVSKLRQPLWAFPAVLAGALTLAVPFFGPTIEPPPRGATIKDYGGQAVFRTRYDQNRAFYGDPIGTCYQRRELLTCPTVFYFMEYHEDQPNSYYQIQNANLGQELLGRRGLSRDSNPVLAPILMAYFAAEHNRAVDRLYWYGHPITNPRIVGERTEQYFDKTVLYWPTGSDDPSQVRRETVGSQLWTLEHTGVDPADPEPWTASRRMLVIGSALLLLLGALPMLLPGLFGRDFTPGRLDSI